MDPRKMILMGISFILLSLLLWGPIIKLKIRKKDAYLLPAQIVIFLYSIFGSQNDINRVKKGGKITPDNEYKITKLMAQALLISLMGLVTIIDGIISIYKR
jgi:hypothetical protein